MKLICKHLMKELLKNRIFIILLLILTAATSFLYFFVAFSVDGNLALLNNHALTREQILYQNALLSNQILAKNVLCAFTALTGFIMFIFYYRFFQLNGKELGCIKALGFQDASLRCFFIFFSFIICSLGELIGMAAGYPAADILLAAGAKSYLVTEQTKGVTFINAAVGLLFPILIWSLITGLSYRLIQGKETGILMKGLQEQKAISLSFAAADKLSGLFPKKQRLPVRLSLRKPVSLLLLLISVMCFSVMFILGYSLNKSSQIVFDSQIAGHHYRYEESFDTIQTSLPERFDKKSAAAYLNRKGSIHFKNNIAECTITGIDENPSLFQLLNRKGGPLDFPKSGEVVISQQLQDLYGLKSGDLLTLFFDDAEMNVKISGIAFNAKAGCIYVSRNELTSRLSLPSDAYSGILYLKENNSTSTFSSSQTTTYEQKLAELDRNAVSNRMSAVINQIIGCFIGIIVLFLALYFNFQSSTKDILILHLMGYTAPRIREILIDIYKPVLNITFFITLLPCIKIVIMVLRSLSIQIGDYMPFYTNPFILLGILVLLNIIYFLVQFTFQTGIRKIIVKEDISQYTGI